MLGRAVEFAVYLAMTHGLVLLFSLVATARRTWFSGGQPAFAQ